MRAMRLEIPRGVEIPAEAMVVGEEPERGVVIVEIPLPPPVEAAIQAAYQAFARGATIYLVAARLEQDRLVLSGWDPAPLPPAAVSRLDLALAWLRQGRIPIPVYPAGKTAR